MGFHINLQLNKSKLHILGKSIREKVKKGNKSVFYFETSNLNIFYKDIGNNT